MEYTVALKETDEGYSVWVPGLPGCWSQGQTREEAVKTSRMLSNSTLKSRRNFCDGKRKKQNNRISSDGFHKE